jgi:hypothetical protein
MQHFPPAWVPNRECRSATAFSELVQTEDMHPSGFFPKEKPPFTALKKSMCIPKMLSASGTSKNKIQTSEEPK